jgi:predicted nucleic-acid-binding protein
MKQYAQGAVILIALDTNVLVRLLVNDPAEKNQINTVKDLCDGVDFLYISQIVQVETVWVLESAYNFDKQSVIKAIEHINSHTLFKLQSPQLFDEALSLFKASNAGLSDCLILVESLNQQVPLATFDKKLGKLSGTQLLSSKQ